MDLDRFREKSKNRSAENRKFLQSLKKKDARLVDDAFHNLHTEVFEEVDCLQCANCCKTTSIKPGDFIETYLRVDEDKDYVLKSSPCPFLDADNYCKVYESRPKACREYPHTDRKKMVQITELTFKNTLVCPAVLEMVERLKKVEL